MTNREWKAKYDHALDRMIDLFRDTRDREIKLYRALDLARDEFKRIKACPDVTAEVSGLCDRGINMTNGLVEE